MLPIGLSMPKWVEPNGTDCSFLFTLCHWIQASFAEAGQVLGEIAGSCMTQWEVLKSRAGSCLPESRWLLNSSKETPQKHNGHLLPERANGKFPCKWEFRVVMGKVCHSPPCLLCVSLCLSESLGEKGLLSREWPVQALEVGNPKINTVAKPLLWAWLCFPICWGGVCLSGTGSPYPACVTSKSCKELPRWVSSLSARIKNEFRRELASPLLLTEWQH